MDFIGLLLFTAGLLLFLMGLSWGGQLYPWASAHVIATMVTGIALLLLFVSYGMSSVVLCAEPVLTGALEAIFPPKQPLVPMHLFRNRDFNVIVLMTTVGGMLYYSMNGKVVRTYDLVLHP